jgi:methylenetetrahydrofolate dehydrogenase (NADP+)/methenyltetrahydrofolate cyclohydrolase
MSAKQLDSRWVCEQIEGELKPRIEQLTASGRKPAVAAVIVGKPGAQISVLNDLLYCRKLGLRARECNFLPNISMPELAEQTQKLNASSEFDSILLALAPEHDASSIRLAITPSKDADGLHPFNLGMLSANQPGPRHRAAAGILELLKRYSIALEGKRVVLAGDRDGNARPLALLLLHENATVTVCPVDAPDLTVQIRNADILVTNLGQPGSLTKESLNAGSVIIDAGSTYISRREEVERIFGRMPEKLEEFRRSGSVMAGDVHPWDANLVASAYLQVPAGSVKPLSRAILASNIVAAAQVHAQNATLA